MTAAKSHKGIQLDDRCLAVCNSSSQCRFFFNFSSKLCNKKPDSFIARFSQGGPGQAPKNSRNRLSSFGKFYIRPLGQDLFRYFSAFVTDPKVVDT